MTGGSSGVHFPNSNLVVWSLLWSKELCGKSSVVLWAAWAPRAMAQSPKSNKCQIKTPFCRLALLDQNDGLLYSSVITESVTPTGDSIPY